MAERPDTPSVRGGHSLQSTSRIVISVYSLQFKIIKKIYDEFYQILNVYDLTLPPS